MLVTYDPTLEDSIDLEAIRDGHRSMTDTELLANGKAAA
jgi:hypothetical protein